MECPHLSSNLKIPSPASKNDILAGQWQCTVCRTVKSSWLCLHCGAVNCGRYVNGHAKEHFEANPEHSICMDCTSYASYCYICDDFIVNDTENKVLEQLRSRLQAHDEAPSTPKERRRRRTNSEDSGSIENRLRKRKRPENNTTNNVKANGKVVGLRNLGNTCFMNAVLQSLSNIQQFCCYFKQLPSLDGEVQKNGRHPKAKCNGGGEDILVSEELRKTLIALWEGGKTSISPESLFSVIWKVVPRFRGYQQQDAHEFLRYMLDRLHTELLNVLTFPEAQSSVLGPKGRSTIVTYIFGGLLQNEVNCLICGTESKKHDPFLDLSLDIPQQCVSRNGNKEDQLPCNLQDCLSSFTELEELAETELYYCSSCRLKQRSTKKFWIRRLPNVLCLHLKRFRWQNYFRIKLDNYVQFPIKGLDMSRFMLTNMHETRGSCGGSSMYDLAAVIVHHGSGAGSGHYTAYATHEGHWYHFNDSTVTRSDEATVAKCKAYIIFYIRRQLNLPGIKKR